MRGPEPTARRFAPDYLLRFLADPSIAAPGSGGGGRMPDLGLSSSETAALAAFLTEASEARR